MTFLLVADRMTNPDVSDKYPATGLAPVVPSLVRYETPTNFDTPRQSRQESRQSFLLRESKPTRILLHPRSGFAIRG